MNMGINVWSFPGEWSLNRIFQAAKAAGFDGVEIALTESGEVNLNSTREEIEAVGAMARANKIELYSVASGLYWSYPLTSNNQAVCEKAKRIVKKQLETASWLGCDTILVIPGSVGIDFMPDSEVIEYDVAYERALLLMNELKGYAERLQVAIGLENVWNKFLLSPLEMRDFIDKIGSEFVGAYLDVGNVVSNGYPEHWIKILGNRIRKVHFKDYRKDAGGLGGFVDLLAGDVDYPAVMAALRSIDYTGWVTAEMSAYRTCPDQLVYNTANSMRRILDV